MTDRFPINFKFPIHVGRIFSPYNSPLQQTNVNKSCSNPTVHKRVPNRSNSIKYRLIVVHLLLGCLHFCYRLSRSQSNWFTARLRYRAYFFSAFNKNRTIAVRSIVKIVKQKLLLKKKIIIGKIHMHKPTLIYIYILINNNLKIINTRITSDLILILYSTFFLFFLGDQNLFY